MCCVECFINAIKMTATICDLINKYIIDNINVDLLHLVDALIQCLAVLAELP